MFFEAYRKAEERLKKTTITTKAPLGYCKKGWKTIHIVTVHVMGATMYGARVVGARPQHRAKIRTLIRSTTSSSMGGSSATALALQKARLLDPAYKAVGLLVLEWQCVSIKPTTKVMRVLNKRICELGKHNSALFLRRRINGNMYAGLLLLSWPDSVASTGIPEPTTRGKPTQVTSSTYSIIFPATSDIFVTKP